MTDVKAPDVEQVLSRLKDFQRATVEYVTHKLYGPEDVRRFLVADEVGLGKTMVARGIVAESINRLWDTKDRIDVIYVCSNQQIAVQNLNRLNPLQDAPHKLASRITLLPLHLRDLADRKVNLVAFTPGTSLDPGNRSGSSRERALLHHLLRATWGDWVTRRDGAWELMRGGAGFDSYRSQFDAISIRVIDPRILATFKARVFEAPELEQEFQHLSDGRSWGGGRPPGPQRNRLMGALRGILAKASIEALDPDLVILDEFQRFTDLLNPNTEAGALASELFNYEGNKVLLLSATPYRMHSMQSDADGSSHYEDFLKTYDFLVNHDEAATEALANDLASLRRGIMTGQPPADLQRVAKSIEARLRKVMVRTERLGSSPDRDGMLRSMPVPELAPTAADIATFAQMDQLSLHLGAPNVMEIWKSSPYLLNFMEDYKLSQGFREHLGAGDEVARRAVSAGHGFLPEGAVERYESFDLANPKVRALMAHLERHHAFELLWLPPTLPTTSLSGVFATKEARDFTKMLIFSAWGVVPRALSALVSYEAERRLLGPLGKGYDERGDISSPLDLRVDRTSLPVPNLLLGLPLPAIAELCDPVAFAKETQRSFPVPVLDLVEHVSGILSQKLAPFLSVAASDGRVDLRWYWVAPLLLARTSREDLSAAIKEAVKASAGRQESTPQEVLRRAFEVVDAVRSGDESMGQPPEDLLEVVALLGLAGPANAWWRTLRMTLGNAADDVSNLDVLEASVTIGRRIVAIFNQPESQQIVRSSCADAPYWRQVLDYSTQGGLPAVLEEFGHLLIDQAGLASKPAREVLAGLSSTAEESLGLRVSSVGVHSWPIDSDRVTRNMRLHLAARIGQEKSEDKGLDRAVNVREAFNSPFWPLVLVSTSVGQEGLDFHPYCHAVAHWNLPTNPVDLEQREGRVHRFKGHAVRKNVASRFGGSPALVGDQAPWDVAFEIAKQGRSPDASDLVPYWVYPIEGGASIERHAFTLPLSRDVERLRDLQTALATYRLAFGQPRQEELMAFLDRWYDEAERALLVDALGIDLAPAGESQRHGESS